MKISNLGRIGTVATTPSNLFDQARITAERLQAQAVAERREGADACLKKDTARITAAANKYYGDRKIFIVTPQRLLAFCDLFSGQKATTQGSVPTTLQPPRTSGNAGGAYCRQVARVGSIMAGGGQIVPLPASGVCPVGFITVRPAQSGPPTVISPIRTGPPSPVALPQPPRVPPNPNVPYAQWTEKPSDAFLLEHHAVANVRDWVRYAISRELRPTQVEKLVVQIQKGDFTNAPRAPEFYLKFKDVIFEYATSLGLPIPEMSPVAVATPVTVPAGQTKVEEVGTSLIPVSTMEEFKEKNPIREVATGKSASTAAPEEGMSMNAKLAAGAAVLAVGYFVWKRRQA